ncbi:MAG: hypothetical protein Q6354_06310 [Candidatus Brocadiales bacterium]|nr:hypothetical protein [Candidatus Brocadiales bacterium]
MGARQVKMFKAPTIVGARCNVPLLATSYLLLATCSLLLATCSGCGLAEKALVTLIAPNPELERLEAQKETTKDGIEAIKDPAVGKEKAKQIVRLVESSQRQGHPSFFSAVVSGLYTEEGRRLAGLAVVALASLGAMGWKMAQATLLGRALDATILGVQEYRNIRPDGGQELKTILSRRHKGLPVDMARRVARVLKET